MLIQFEDKYGWQQNFLYLNRRIISKWGGGDAIPALLTPLGGRNKLEIF